MSALLDLLPRARALEGLTPAADALLADLLGQLLLMEGPPPAPIPDVSQDHRKGIIRSDKGRPICYAESWATGPWICLLLEAPSVGMKRPIPIKDSPPGGSSRRSWTATPRASETGPPGVPRSRPGRASRDTASRSWATITIAWRPGRTTNLVADLA